MPRLLLICLLVLMAGSAALTAQDSPDESFVPPQVMSLGRGAAQDLAWHPEGELLAVGSASGLWLYDMDFDVVAHFKETGDTRRIAWSPEGRQIATYSAAGALQTWDLSPDLSALTPYLNFAANDADQYGTVALEWSPQRNRLAIADGAGVHIFDATNAVRLTTIVGGQTTIAWHPDGTHITAVINIGTTGSDTLVGLWDVTNGNFVTLFETTIENLSWSALAWSPDASMLVGVPESHAPLHVWDAETGNIVNEINPNGSDLFPYIGVWWSNSNDQSVIAVSQNGSGLGGIAVETWDSTTWTLSTWSSAEENIRVIKKHPTQDIWATLDSFNRVNVSALTREPPIQSITLHSVSGTMLRWSPDSTYIASADSGYFAVDVWELVTTGESRLNSLMSPFYPIFMVDDLRWRADSLALVGILSDIPSSVAGHVMTGQVLEWDVPTQEFIRVVSETPGYLAMNQTEVTYLPVLYWNNTFSQVVTQVIGEPLVITDTGYAIATEDAIEISPDGTVSEILWSPDDRLIAVSTDAQDGASGLNIYNAETGEVVYGAETTPGVSLDNALWSPDSALIAVTERSMSPASTQSDFHVVVYAINTQGMDSRLLGTMPTAESAGANAPVYAWHPESRALALSSTQGVEVFAVGLAGVDDQLIAAIPNVSVRALAWSPDARLLAGSHTDGTLRIWDVADIPGLQGAK